MAISILIKSRWQSVQINNKEMLAADNSLRDSLQTRLKCQSWRWPHFLWNDSFMIFVSGRIGQSHTPLSLISSFPFFKWKQSQFRGITQKKQHCFWHFILRANSHSWVGVYRLNHDPAPLISRKRWQGCASGSRIRLNSFLVTSRRFVIFFLVCYVPYLKKLTSPISQTGEPSVIVCISLAELHCKWYACMVTVLELPIRILHYLENKANC